MIQGAVSSNDLALGSCQWLIQVQLTLVINKQTKISEVEDIYFILLIWKEFHTLARKASLRSPNVNFNNVGLSWVSN